MSDTRAEHMAWCKKRALAYLDAGDLDNALTSMASDLRKHPETDKPAATSPGCAASLRGSHDAG